jgi:glutathione S-transferase
LDGKYSLVKIPHSGYIQSTASTGNGLLERLTPEQERDTTEGPAPVRLYDSTIASGNSYKVRLLLAQLRIECPVQELDILASPSETRRPEFLAKNPNGRVPVLELADGTFLAESDAMLFYLAEGSEFWPEQHLQRAQVLQWLFFEQYSHEPYIAVMKFWRTWGGIHNKRPDEVALWQDRGQQALRVMDRHLRTRHFFVAERYTIADIALYAYTHTAGLMGFDMDAVPAVRAWLERVASQPRHVRIANGPGSTDPGART